MREIVNYVNLFTALTIVRMKNAYGHLRAMTIQAKKNLRTGLFSRDTVWKLRQRS